MSDKLFVYVICNIPCTVRASNSACDIVSFVTEKSALFPVGLTDLVIFFAKEGHLNEEFQTK